MVGAAAEEHKEHKSIREDAFSYMREKIIEVTDLRIGVIDIGTNSTRLLVTETSGESLLVLGQGLISTRLGEGLASGSLSAPAMYRTIEALRQFLNESARLGTERLLAVATSAVRDAENRNEFLQLVSAETDLAVKVLSGPEEAEMSYLGVLKGLAVPLDQCLVIDVGGGSTEFIWKNQARIIYRSIRAGAVRMTENGSDRAGIREVLLPILQEIAVVRPGSLVGVGGTLTTLAAIAQALEPYDPTKVHGYYLSREKVEEILGDLMAQSLAARRQLPGLQPERADIIVAGARIVAVILQELGLSGVTVSETDIMFGVTYELLEKINGYFS